MCSGSASSSSFVMCFGSAIKRLKALTRRRIVAWTCAKRSSCSSLYGSNGRKTVCSWLVSNINANTGGCFQNSKRNDSSSSPCEWHIWVIGFGSLGGWKKFLSFPEGERLFEFGIFWVFTYDVLTSPVVGPAAANLSLFIFTLKPSSAEAKQT